MEIIFKKLTEVAITNGKILNKQNDYEKNIISRQCKKDFLQFREVGKHLSHKNYFNYQNQNVILVILKDF